MQEFILLVYGHDYSGHRVWREEKILLDLTSVELCKETTTSWNKQICTVRTKSGQDLRLKTSYEEFKKQWEKAYWERDRDRRSLNKEVKHV